MAHAVVAGASGLTGLALVKALAARGSAVTAVARRPGPSGLPANVNWVIADVGAAGWSAALPETYDVSYALFQSPEFREFPAKASNVFATNVGGLQEMLDHATKSTCKRFIFTSTGGLYAPSAEPLTEVMPLTTGGPLGYYLTTKRCGELLVESYAGLFETLIARPFFIYGPDQSASMLMPRLIQTVRDGRSIGLQGADGLIINPIHADDAARLLAAVAERSVTGIVNLAGPRAVTLREIGEVISSKLGITPVFDVNASATPPRTVADITRMQALLGTPEIDPGVGIAGMC